MDFCCNRLQFLLIILSTFVVNRSPAKQFVGLTILFVILFLKMLRLFVVKVYFFVYGVTVFVVTPSTLGTNQHGGILVVNTGKDRAKEIHLFVFK
jgi:hypothetical protein